MSASTVTPYEPGRLVAGKYELETELGQGGMGVVWRARNVALDSLVAIKVLRATSDIATLRGRMLQEARAVAKLTHPAIVKVFDVGQTESGDPFIVMELLQGDSLGQILEREGRLPAVQAVRSLLPIIDALWLAHGKGIVHRDLKPDNVFIVEHDGGVQPTLVDFGIVKLQGSEVEGHLTNSGDVLGSPDYMSPEQARGQDDVGHLSDIWSMCVVLYEAIAGDTPFESSNYNALLRQIVEVTPPTLRELAAADDALSTIVMRGLSKQPDQRFASMGALGRELATWLLQQGVTEDICGSTLETKWLRSTDPHGRGARVTLASISDAWTAESGSGVRPNVFRGPVHTLRAPPEGSSPPPNAEPGSIGAQVLRERPDARSKRMRFAAVGGLLVLTLTGVALGRWLLSPAGSPPPAGNQQPSAGSSAPTAPPTVVPVLAQTPAVPSAAVSEKRAHTAGEKVSSASERGSGAAPSARPVPPTRRKIDPSLGPAKAPPGDLMSPY